MTLTKHINFEKTYFYLVLAFALTLPLSRAAISLFTILFPLIWIIEGGMKNKINLIKSSKALLALAAFLAFSYLSYIWADDKKVALDALRVFLYLFSIFVLATSLKPEWSEKIITFFLYGMFISEICAYIIFFDIYPINGRLPNYPSPFMMHIDYSIYLAFVAILLLHRILSKSYNIKEKAFMFMFFLSVTINLFISVGRTGQLGFIFALFVSIILHFKLTIKSLLIFTLLSTTIFYGAYKTSDTFHARIQAGLSDIEKIKQGNLSSSFGTRVAYIIVSYDIFLDNPILGVGAGNNRAAVAKCFEEKDYGLTEENKNFMKKFHLHNQYLMVLIPFGLIGLLFFLSWFYYLLRLKIPNQHLKELSILFLTIFLVGFIAEPLFRKQFTVALFVLFSAVFINASLKLEKEKRD